MFAATCATIVSGAIAGRTKYSVFGIFAVIMTGLIYPIAGGWEWGDNGWLNNKSIVQLSLLILLDLRSYTLWVVGQHLLVPSWWVPDLVSM